MTDKFTIEWEPLTAWPDVDTSPRKQPLFKAKYDDTLKLCREELEAIDTVGVVVIQVVTRNGHADLRRDGQLAVRANVIHPGVRISFTSRFGPTTIATDAFAERYFNRPPDWQANFRAIVLGLAALRAIDRYGIASSGEQYRGWQQLASTGSAGMSREIAQAVLAEESGESMSDIRGAATEVLDAIVRKAKRNAHPDANKDDQTRWDALMQALDALGLTA